MKNRGLHEEKHGPGRKEEGSAGWILRTETPKAGAVVVVRGSQEGGTARIEAEDENGKVT